MDLLHQSGESLAGRIASVELGPFDVLDVHPADLLDQLSLIRVIDLVRPREPHNLAAMSFVPALWRSGSTS